MPIIRKVVDVGNSRGITLPKSWIELTEEENGQKLTQIAMEVDSVLTIEPIFKKKEGMPA